MSEELNELSRLERTAVRIFRGLEDSTTEAVHQTGDLVSLVSEMRAVERAAIWRAAGAGALCGIVTWLGVYSAGYVEPMPHDDWGAAAVFYGISLSVGITATALEILYLYWDCLRAGHRLSQIAGHPEVVDPDSDDAHCLALVRASLEIPNPRTPVFGIDPLSESRRWVLILYAVTYKLKVSVTNFIAKAVIRRLSGRLAGRVYIELGAVPVFATWNALICSWMLRQARVRALGPHLVHTAVERFFPDGVGALTLEQQATGLLVLRKVVVQTAAFHPNVARLLRRYLEQTSYPLETLKARYPDLESALSDCDEGDRTTMLELLAMGCAIEGVVTKKNRRCLAAYQSHVGRDIDLSRLDAYLGFALEGRALSEIMSEVNEVGA